VWWFLAQHEETTAEDLEPVAEWVLGQNRVSLYHSVADLIESSPFVAHAPELPTGWLEARLARCSNNRQRAVFLRAVAERAKKRRTRVRWTKERFAAEASIWRP
jgi:hypothetical protein